MQRNSMQIKCCCLRCGKRFWRWRSQIARGIGKFCSRACHDQSRPRKPLAERFWKYVNKTDSCWLWTGGKNNQGYGHFDGKRILAHRCSWELAFGKIAAGISVLHNCPAGDNRACVNPAHLWIGTKLDNMRDCKRKGRTARGDKNGQAKLTTAHVLEIRGLHGRVSSPTLARRFGVSQSRITCIWRRECWQHV